MPSTLLPPARAAACATLLAVAGTGMLHAQTNSPAPGGASAAAGSASAAGGGGASSGLYKVTDGYKVDSATMDGFRAWRSAACDRCHGPNQEGMVGPSLINSLKVLSKEDFKNVVLNGRLEKGMPSFNTNDQVVKHIDQLYAYLKGRSDGAITRAKVEEMK
jgi:mono/diheme cytochrome c family protein